MKCPLCGKDVILQQKQVGTNENGEPIMNQYAICKDCKKQWNLDKQRAKKMAAKMTDALKCDGFNIVQNNGEPAGQTVFHFHMHLIPRYKGDKVGITWEPGTLTDEVKKEVLEKLKN